MYMTDLDYPSELGKIENLIADMEDATDIVRAVDSWYPNYKIYLNDHLNLAEEGMCKDVIFLFQHLTLI